MGPLAWSGLGLGDLKIAAGGAVLSVLKNLSIASTVQAGVQIATNPR